MADNSPYSIVQNNIDLSNKQLELVRNDIQLKSIPSQVTTPQLSNSTWGVNDILGTPKQSSQEFSNITLDSQYTELNSGERILKFPNYSTYLNSEEILAQNQSTGDKWKNGLLKFGLKTGTAVIGGTVGIVNDLIVGINKGSLEAAYNSDLNKWLDDLNTKLDYKLPNYYTEQEKNEGFLSSTTNANFWANDVLGGLSFTTGAILSEGIWAAATGGTSLLSTAGRWSTKALGAERAFKALNQWKTIAKTPFLQSVRRGEQAAEGLSEISGAYKTASNTLFTGKRLADQTRFFFTSAGYEAAIEARHYMKETEEQWYQQFQNTSGRKPTAEEISDFKRGLTDSANTVFMANLPLIGGSNAITFGKLALGKSVSEGVSENWLKRNLFGIGFDKGIDGTYTAIKATQPQKIAARAWGVAKYGLTEGFGEEGGQSVISNTAQNYILKGYDSKNLNASYDMMDALYDAVSHTYGSSEGFKEVGIGTLIGILGGGISDVSTGAGLFGSVGQERKALEKAVEYRNDFTANMVIDRLKSSSRIMDAQKRSEEAEHRNDFTGQILSDKEAMIINISRDEKFQGTEQGKLDFAESLNQIPDADLAEDLGIDVADIPAWKETKIADYNNLSDTHVKNLRFADSLLGDRNIAGFKNLQYTRDDVREAIATTFTLGENSLKMSQDFTRLIKANVANTNANAAIDVDFVLDQISNEKKNEYNRKAKQFDTASKNFDRIAKRVVDLEQFTASDNEGYKNELSVARQQMITLQEQMNTLAQEKQLAFDAMGVENFSNDTLITSDMLDNQSANVSKLRETLKDIRQTDPQRYAMLDKLIYEQSKAVRYTKELDSISRKILDPNTRVKTIDGWVDNLLSRNKSLNESTQKFFEESLSNYRTTVSLENIDRIVSEVENAYDSFKKDNSVPVDFLQKLQQKVKNGETLSAREKEMYDANQAEAVANDEDSMETAPSNIRSSGITIREKIQDLLDSEPVYEGTDLEETVKNKPSEADKGRYQELQDKIPADQKENWQRYLYGEIPYDKDFGITQDEANELQVLNSRLNDWKTLDGIREEDSSVAQWIDLLNNTNLPVTENPVKADYTPKDYATIASTAQVPENNVGKSSVSTLNVPDKVGATKSTKNYEFSFVSIQEFQSRFPDSQLYYVDKSGAEKIANENLLRKFGKKEGEKFKIKLPNGEGILLTIGERSRIKVDVDSLNTHIRQSDIRLGLFSGEKFILAYKKLDNGEFVPMESDFTFKTTNGENFINKQLLNSLPSGTVLRTVIDSDSSYNQQLFEDLKSAEKKFNAGKIDEDELNTEINRVKSSLEIYAYHNNEFVGSMRSLTKEKPDNQDANRNMEVRNKAFELLQMNKFRGQIDLQQTLTLNAVLLAPPNLRMTEDSDGNLIPENIDFTQDALKNVVGTGYILDTKVSTNFKGKINETYINPIASKNKGQKVPFVVVRLGKGRDVAYPISLIKTTIDKSQSLTDILNSQDLSKAAKANQFVNYLRENNIAFGNNIDFTLNDWWINNPNVESILEKLVNTEDFLDPELLAGNFNRQQLIGSAQVSVDLSDLGNAFSAGKPLITINEVRPYDDLQTLNEQYGNVEQQRTAMEKELSDELVSMYREVNSNPAFESITDNKFTDVFDEADIDTVTDSYTNHRKNIKLLRQALASVTPKIKKILGVENIAELNRKLTQFDALQKKEKNIRVEIRSQEIKNQTENSKSIC